VRVLVTAGGNSLGRACGREGSKVAVEADAAGRARPRWQAGLAGRSTLVDLVPAAARRRVGLGAGRRVAALPRPADGAGVADVLVLADVAGRVIHGRPAGLAGGGAFENLVHACADRRERLGAEGPVAALPRPLLGRHGCFVCSCKPPVNEPSRDQFLHGRMKL
jgi:hypothetical protein